MFFVDFGGVGGGSLAYGDYSQPPPSTAYPNTVTGGAYPQQGGAPPPSWGQNRGSGGGYGGGQGKYQSFDKSST